MHRFKYALVSEVSRSFHFHFSTVYLEINNLCTETHTYKYTQLSICKQMMMLCIEEITLVVSLRLHRLSPITDLKLQRDRSNLVSAEILSI